MATPGYTSVSKTKESGAPFQPIPAGQWTRVDLGMLKLPRKVNVINAQLYFEGLPAAITKMEIRVARGNGNPTAQDAFLVRGPFWARSYADIDYAKDDATDDGYRGIEVWSEHSCLLQTRIFKAARPVMLDGEIA